MSNLPAKAGVSQIPQSKIDALKPPSVMGVGKNRSLQLSAEWKELIAEYAGDLSSYNQRCAMRQLLLFFATLTGDMKVMQDTVKEAASEEQFVWKEFKRFWKGLKKEEKQEAVKAIEEFSIDDIEDAGDDIEAAASDIANGKQAHQPKDRDV